MRLVSAAAAFHACSFAATGQRRRAAALERLLAERDAELDRLRPQTSTATLS